MKETQEGRYLYTSMDVEAVWLYSYKEGLMGIEDPKLRLIVLLLVNVLVAICLKYWVFNTRVFVSLLNGLPSG